MYYDICEANMMYMYLVCCMCSQRKCHSKGNALVFDNSQAGYNFASTRDVALDAGLTISPQDIVNQQDFDGHSLKGSVSILL